MGGSCALRGVELWEGTVSGETPSCEQPTLPAGKQMPSSGRRRWMTAMLHLTCQLDSVAGCPDISLSIILGVSVSVVFLHEINV